MNIRIYQIDRERDVDRRMFMDSHFLSQKFGEVKPVSASYGLIYEGKVDCKSLEDVYRMFNRNHPVEFMGHSLSVSDVVEVVDGGAVRSGFYFCDAFGFREVPFEPDKARNLADRGAINVVIVEPGKAARTAYIDGSLFGMQRVVGGDIEMVCPFSEEVCLICNEEGKVNGLPLNRALYDGEGNVSDMIAGTFFVCGSKDSEFVSLTDDQLNRYTERFKTPERFIQTATQFVAIPDPVRKGGEIER